MKLRELVLVWGLGVSLLSLTGAQRCEEGFQWVNRHCVDVDECLDEDDESDFVGPCGRNAKCFNTEGSYYCQCEDGFRSSTNTVNFTAQSPAVCLDINECVEDRNICGPNTVCYNDIPGYTCYCKDGFASSNGTREFNKGVSVSCRDVDECLQENICGKHRTCKNSLGGYSCVCKEGFVLSGNPERCEDVDECLDEEDEPDFVGTCGTNAKCFNTAGSFYCQCEDGFRSSTNTVNFTAKSCATCSDINECIEDRNICGPNTVCSNLIPGYTCSCKDGFTSSNGTTEFNKGVSCRDVDECLQENICGKHATCTNSEGGYSCVCDEGFVLSGNPERCEDINECLEDRNICGPNTVCSNLRPGYTCSCKDGFASSTGVKEFQKGISCRDVDECLQENICKHTGQLFRKTTCENLEGSYICVVKMTRRVVPEYEWMEG